MFYLFFIKKLINCKISDTLCYRIIKFKYMCSNAGRSMASSFSYLKLCRLAVIVVVVIIPSQKEINLFEYTSKEA